MVQNQIQNRCFYFICEKCATDIFLQVNTFKNIFCLKQVARSSLAGDITPEQCLAVFAGDITSEQCLVVVEKKFVIRNSLNICNVKSCFTTSCFTIKSKYFCC